MAGFGQSQSAAERSLIKSSKELRALRKIIEKYKDDPKGKKKMLKKMQKYWRSNLSIVHGMDAKPTDYMKDLEEDLGRVGQQLVEDPREEEGDNHETVLTDHDMSAIRDIISKDTKDS
tara:strand:+ start:208 stop:561 length:354 start_codon:yes stop_codon:yes gene_type:complete